MEVEHCRNPQDISEDDLCEAIDLNAEFRAALVIASRKNHHPINEKSLRAYNRWEKELEDLVESCEPTGTWRNRVLYRLREWRFEMSRMP